MKRTQIYFMIFCVMIIAAGFVVVKYKNEERKKSASFYLLKERTGSKALTNEWTAVKKRYTDLMKEVGTNPGDVKSRIALAGLYIQEARVTGDYPYYDMAAMKYLNEVLDDDSLNFEALSLKSLCYLSQHHFSDGLAIAEKARNVNPYNAFVYGILVDGQVETGNYTAAVEDADKMVSIRPDLRSYSRISYLREIYGDYPGAIEAMKMAVNAGPPGDESTEWARVQLGHLYENIGDLTNAEMNYQLSLEYRPLYAYAIAGQARIAMAKKDFARAISDYMMADTLVSDYSFREGLADAYMMAGKKELADKITGSLIDAMSKDAKKGMDNENIGHYGDRELAYNYLSINEYDKALEHAIAEYNRRPLNIDANETVAWVYYKMGKAQKALSYMERALKTNSRNPVILCHTGLAYAQIGNKEKAGMLLKEGLKNNPNISWDLKTEAMKALEKL